MTDKRATPDPDDLLQHYRQHSPGEPPAALDAFILDTARREAPAPQMSVWQRWRNICKQPRWQMTFADTWKAAPYRRMAIRSGIAPQVLAGAIALRCWQFPLRFWGCLSAGLRRHGSGV